MQFQGIIVCFGLLACCCSLGSAVDCTSQVSMKNAQIQCFRRYGVEVDSNADQIQDAIQNDIVATCQNKVGYAQGLRCALSMARDCMIRLGQDPNILPDPAKAEDGVEYLCDNIHNMDSQCIKDQTQPMKECALSKAMSFFSANPSTDIGFITCKAFDIALECAQEKLGQCGGQTSEVVIYYTQHYILPPACKSSVQPDPGYAFFTATPMTTMAPMTTMELVTGIPMLPEYSCYSQQSIQDGQKKCFDNEGLSITLPHVSVGDSGQEMKKSYLDAVLSNNEDFHAFCRQLPQYQRGMGCAMEVARRCMPDGYKDYLPESRKIQQMLAELCRHVDEIDTKCVLNRASALYDCGFRMGSKLRTTDVKQLLCNAFKFNAQCQKEVLPPCGCRTTRLYVDISRKYLNPPACPAIHESVPVCVAGTDKFEAGLASADKYEAGLAAQSVASAALVTIAAVLARLFFLA